MNKQEFETLAGPLTVDVFEVINYVYTYHTSINEVGGKQQVADLFKSFGMRVIHDMVPTATQAKELEEAIRTKSLELDVLREKLTILRMG